MPHPSDRSTGPGEDSEERPHETTLTAEYSEPRWAGIVEAAITRELDRIADDRTRASVERDGETLRVRIVADDLVGLRAGLNTWLTLLEVAERSIDAAT